MNNNTNKNNCVNNIIKHTDLECLDYTTFIMFSADNIRKNSNSIIYYSCIFFENADIEDFNKNKINQDFYIHRLDKNSFYDNFLFFIVDTDPFNELNLDKYGQFEIKTDRNEQMMVFYIHILQFFSEKAFDTIFGLKKKNIVLWFNGCSIGFVKAMFRTQNISLSSGNNTLKGVLSYNDMALSLFVYNIFGEVKSRYLIDKSFRVLTKNKILTRSIFDHNNFNDQKLLEIYVERCKNLNGFDSYKRIGLDNLPRLSTIKRVNTSIRETMKIDNTKQNTIAKQKKMFSTYRNIEDSMSITRLNNFIHHHNFNRKR